MIITIYQAHNSQVYLMLLTINTSFTSLLIDLRIIIHETQATLYKLK